MTKPIHYAGRIDFRGGWILAGWAACCSGINAENIRDRKEHTHDRQAVTCKRCLKMLDKDDRFHKDHDSRDLLVAAIKNCDAECGASPAALSNLCHLHEDHDGPTPEEAKYAMKYCSGSLKEKLEDAGLRVKYSPKWVEDIRITRTDKWELQS